MHRSLSLLPILLSSGLLSGLLAQDPLGTWQGALRLGNQYSPVTIRIAWQGEELVANLEVPNRNILGLPMTVELDAPGMRLEMNSPVKGRGVFNGVLKEGLFTGNFIHEIGGLRRRGKFEIARVVELGRGQLRESFGVTDLESKEPATPKTLYQLGSLSKVFAATLFGILQDEGLVRLDEPVRSYLPEDRSFPVLEGEEGSKITPARNLGFGLLGHVLGRVAGSSLEGLARDRVLEPVDMGDTSISRTPEREARLATHDWVSNVSPISGATLSQLHEPRRCRGGRRQGAGRAGVGGGGAGGPGPEYGGAGWRPADPAREVGCPESPNFTRPGIFPALPVGLAGPKP